jgi:hypothetical protein
MVLKTTPQTLQEGGHTNGQEYSGETNLKTSGSGMFQIACLFIAHQTAGFSFDCSE